MRLKNLTGFELRPKPPLLEDGSPGVADVYRLVAFTTGQSEPVYISEEFKLSSTHSTFLNSISFERSPLYRSFRLAVQLWAAPADKQQAANASTWKVSLEWILDLRQLRPIAHKNIHSKLVIHTDLGPMVLPSTADDDNNIAARTGYLASNTAQYTVNTARPENMTSKINSGSSYPAPFQFSSALSSPPPASSGAVTRTNNTSPTDRQDDSLVNRWFSWGREALNGTAQDTKTSEKSKLTSFSFPTLVDLWTLQHSLDEARVSAREISDQLNDLLPSASLPLTEKKASITKRLHRIRHGTRIVQAEVKALKEDAETSRKYQYSIKSKLDASLDKAIEIASHNDKAIKDRPAQLDLSDTATKIRREQGRLSSELLTIFPIDLVGDGKFHFAINGLLLPSVFAINHYDTTQVGAALGFVAQVLVCLSRYLDIALPYPITVFGSQSYITDNISRIRHGSNKFPLWTRGALLYRVEYALYLLHKDIEHLMNSLQLPVSDLKQTLANLKNILLVLSAEYIAPGYKDSSNNASTDSSTASIDGSAGLQKLELINASQDPRHPEIQQQEIQ